ncbi:winged helix-turn-helix domain-containing protein [Salinicola avicenniae]|uniref:winged helix-turn-helix domain-containing protein n=1 Tax=Salinicola avicenniae TaxID=2916836 RepID=UPI00207349D4|nr:MULTISPECIES: winged helix-turn-helix domain-containing protein [unclassified Salinicola]
MTRTHHPKPRFQVRLVADSEIVIGPGKIDLLAAIDQHGSISAACREMRLSYKKAWQLIDTMNRHCATPVVTTAIGGTRRGGAELTPLGHELIAHYRQLTATLARDPAGEALMAALTPIEQPDGDSNRGTSADSVRDAGASKTSAAKDAASTDND